MSATIGTDVARAARLLREGGLVALPTETVYGLGGNALHESAATRIFAAKHRPRFDPLILHQASAERVFDYAREVPTAARKLAEACWPGPLTLVLPRAAMVPDLVTAGLDTVALRVPDHLLTLQVLERLDFPVAAPSANPFGFVSPVTAAHVAEQLEDRIDYILDGGPCRVGLESTIVAFGGARPRVLRKGGTPVEVVKNILDGEVSVAAGSSSRPRAPGMLSSHYSPGLPIELVDSVGERHGDAATAVVRFGGGAASDVHIHDFDLSPSGDLEEAARTLFTTLRRLAAGSYTRAVIERVPERGLGRAINDRLRRAAAPPNIRPD